MISRRWRSNTIDITDTMATEVLFILVTNPQNFLMCKCLIFHYFTWLYFPSEERRAEDFFALKSPDGFNQVLTHELGYLKAACYP